MHAITYVYIFHERSLSLMFWGIYFYTLVYTNFHDRWLYNMLSIISLVIKSILKFIAWVLTYSFKYLRCQESNQYYIYNLKRWKSCTKSPCLNHRFFYLLSICVYETFNFWVNAGILKIVSMLLIISCWSSISITVSYLKFVSIKLKLTKCRFRNQKC